MSFGIRAALLFLLCTMTQALLGADTGFTELNDLNRKEHRCQESLNVLFTYHAPQKFSKGDKLFLYFFVVDLANNGNVKTFVKKIIKPTQKVQQEVHLKSSELVYAFIFSKEDPFVSFKNKHVGFLKINIDQNSNKRLGFEKYDPNTGAALFDPFQLERLNPPL